MDRAGFLCGAAISLASAGAPKPTPTPEMRTWDTCEKNPVLPYDRPIDVTMQVLDGPDFHLRDYRGRAVLLNIFATWCGPCNKEQPGLVAIAKRYEDQGLAVIGIDDREEDNDVRAYRKKYGITYPIAMDRRGGFTRALQVGTENISVEFPTTIFVSPNGYLYCYVRGNMAPDELEYRIKKFLVDEPPTATPSPSPSASPTPST
jgi:thiol-disulfide isomerase/thioredoxin